MSIWDTAVRHQLVDECRADARAAQLYVDVLGKLREKFYDRRLVDDIVQRFDETLLIEDAYCFAKLWTEMGVGLIHVHSIDIGNEPRGDADREYNHNKLQQLNGLIHRETGLPLKLKVEFWGGAGDQDGYVELRSDLIFERAVCKDGCCPAMTSVARKRTWFPLEVGTTTAARTLGHLRQERGLVRWPYGSNAVTFLYVPRICDPATKGHPYDPAI